MPFTLYIKDLNTKPETLKLVQDRAVNTLDLISIGNDFPNRTQMVQQQRGLYEIKKLIHNKRNGHQIEEVAHRMVENLCQLYI
jgi:hypothetical protein